jgi:hypothetical protein
MEHLVDRYELAQKQWPGQEMAPGSPAEQTALDRFARFFGQLTDKNARELTRQTYAENFYFFDTLKYLSGREALEEYFVETARNTESVQARITDVARSGSNYYVRWTMDIRLKKFRRGETLRSVGLTHLRFDEMGLIVLHHDYWDTTSGFFEHVPGLGSVLRWIRAKF